MLNCSVLTNLFSNVILYNLLTDEKKIWSEIAVVLSAMLGIPWTKPVQQWVSFKENMSCNETYTYNQNESFEISGTYNKER